MSLQWLSFVGLLSGGAVLLTLGVGVILLSLPRGSEVLRPHMRNAVSQSMIAPLCLGLIVFGFAMMLVSF